MINASSLSGKYREVSSVRDGDQNGGGRLLCAANFHASYVVTYLTPMQNFGKNWEEVGICSVVGISRHFTLVVMKKNDHRSHFFNKYLRFALTFVTVNGCAPESLLLSQRILNFLFIASDFGIHDVSFFCACVRVCVCVSVQEYGHGNERDCLLFAGLP